MESKNPATIKLSVKSTIFDKADSVEKAIAEETAYNGFFRLSYLASNGRINICVMSDMDVSLLENVRPFVKIYPANGVLITFTEKEPNVIAKRAKSEMLMNLQLVKRDTYIPMKNVTQIEYLDSVEDVENIIQLLKDMQEEQVEIDKRKKAKALKDAEDVIASSKMMKVARA